jgi:hypothetical protein
MAGNPDYLLQDLNRYVNATPAGVEEHARRWLKPDAFVQLEFVPRTTEEQ